MTEEEAKTKRCCGGRDCGAPAADGALMCIASACMAWRWQWRQGKESGAVFQSTISGWCGLAGEDLSP